MGEGAGKKIQGEGDLLQRNHTVMSHTKPERRPSDAVPSAGLEKLFCSSSEAKPGRSGEDTLPMLVPSSSFTSESFLLVVARSTGPERRTSLRVEN